MYFRLLERQHHLESGHNRHIIAEILDNFTIIWDKNTKKLRFSCIFLQKNLFECSSSCKIPLVLYSVKHRMA